MNVKALVFQKRPFSKVDSLLTSQGFTKMGAGPSVNYRAALKDSSTESIYYLEIPVEQVDSHGRIGRPNLYGRKRIPEPVWTAVESKLYEIADYLKSRDEHLKHNGRMTNNEKEIKRLWKEMESIQTHSENKIETISGQACCGVWVYGGILHLNYLEGVSQRTIAHQLGISQMIVSRIIRQAIEKLRQSLIEPVTSIG